MHQDHHGLWISRDGRRIIEANDGGAPISIDGGRTWDWRFNVVLAQVYRIGYDVENPYHVCGGIQDNDSYCGPSDSLSRLGIDELGLARRGQRRRRLVGVAAAQRRNRRFGTSA